jgi:predicted DNA-binding antitoxin AbrB/MazE fold protein
MRTIEAIFEGGVFRPLDRVELPDHERVRLTVESPQEVAERELAAWEQVYTGLTENEIAELEKVVNDRTQFMWPQG